VAENSPIGEYIKISRIQEGYKTQKQLSEASGVSQTTLSRIEAGLQKPQPDTLLQLSRYLRSATYGELMEKAGYLDGLSEADKAFMSEFFDEHAMLDENIEIIIKDLSKHDIFPIDVMKRLHSELKPLFDSKKIEIIEWGTPRRLTELIKILDLDTEFKNKIYKALLRVEKLLRVSHPASGSYGKESPSMELSEDEQRLITSYRKLSHDNQMKISGIIEFMFGEEAATEEGSDGQDKGA
jgi:transcriptional regulator with XRE-family HTH domain